MRFLANEIDTEITENDRVLDTVQALESLLETVAVLPEDLSETDQALIRSNLQMAVTGTDIEAVEFTPGLESLSRQTLYYALNLSCLFISNKYPYVEYFSCLETYQNKNIFIYI